MTEYDLYDKIKKKYDFRHLFENKELCSKVGISNVEIEKKASTSKSTQYRIEDNVFNSSRIVIFMNHQNGKVPFYKNETYPQDKGDIIQFISNRLTSKSKKEAALILEGSSLKADEVVSYNKKESIKNHVFNIEDFKNKNMISADHYEGEREHFLLSDRKIKQETLEDPLFKNKVFLFEPFENNPNYKNAFFPKYDNENSIKGAEIKYCKPNKKGNTNHVEGDPCLLWTSNKPEKVRNVVIVESAIDALSKHQEFPDIGAFYISTNGNLYKDRVDQIFSICQREEIDLDKAHIIASHDNDLAGFKYDLILINSLLNPLESFDYIKDKTGVGIRYSVVNESSLKNLEETKSYFEHIKKTVNLEELKQGFENRFAKVDTRTLSVSLYFPRQEMFSKYLRKLSFSLSEKLSFVKSTGIKIERPPQTKNGNIKDWNDYTKKIAKENPPKKGHNHHKNSRSSSKSYKR